MAEFKVDPVRYEVCRSKEKLSVWVFNDPGFYAGKARQLVAKYDFGRKPIGEDSSPADKRQKLLVGMYREPFRDGWKYTLNTRLHPEMAATVMRYILYGFRTGEDGKREPFTYLRHNRKALGIHYLFLRYYECAVEAEAFNREHPSLNLNYKTDLIDFYAEPYFPTPENYDGVNRGRRL